MLYKIEITLAHKYIQNKRSMYPCTSISKADSANESVSSGLGIGHSERAAAVALESKLSKISLKFQTIEHIIKQNFMAYLVCQINYA